MDLVRRFLLQRPVDSEAAAIAPDGTGAVAGPVHRRNPKWAAAITALSVILLIAIVTSWGLAYVRDTNGYPRLRISLLRRIGIPSTIEFNASGPVLVSRSPEMDQSENKYGTYREAMGFLYARLLKRGMWTTTISAPWWFLAVLAAIQPARALERRWRRPADGASGNGRQQPTVTGS